MQTMTVSVTQMIRTRISWECNTTVISASAHIKLEKNFALSLLMLNAIAKFSFALQHSQSVPNHKLVIGHVITRVFGLS